MFQVNLYKYIHIYIYIFTAIYTFTFSSCRLILQIFFIFGILRTCRVNKQAREAFKNSSLPTKFFVEKYMIDTEYIEDRIKK